MLKGDISNLFADTVIIDANIIYTPKHENLLDKALSLLQTPKFKLIHPYIPRYLETLFYNGYAIYILDRNQAGKIRGEKLFEDMCYSEYIHTTDLQEIQALFQMRRVVAGFVDRDVSAPSYGKQCWNFVNWQDTMDKIRRGYNGDSSTSQR